MKRALLVVMLIITVGGLGWWLLPSNGQEQDLQPYATAPLTRGTLERTVSSTGALAAVETVDVGTEVSGTIERILVDFNSRVRQGEVLAILKQDLFQAAVSEAEATLMRARSDRKLAELELARNLPLFERGFISEQEFTPRQIDLEKAKAAVNSAEATLFKAKTNLANSVIRSPIDGTVIQRSIDEGQTVAASLNTPTLFIIARNLQQMQIEADVDETDIGQIREGQTVRFSVQSYPDQQFAGVVRQIRLQPTVISNVVTYTVIVSADNRDGELLPGMTATLDFIVEKAEDVLLLPNAALRFRPTRPAGGQNQQTTAERAPRQGQGPRVFVPDPIAGLRPVPVTIGGSDGQSTVLLKGELQAGDAVIVGNRQPGQEPQTGFSLFGAMRGKRK
jgi:HlyD family secretion protein